MDNKTSGTTKNSSLFQFQLKPSSFVSTHEKGEQNGSSENGNNANIFINNPFLKCDKEGKEKELESNKTSDSAKDTTTTNLFKPATTNLLKNASSSTLSENSNFVFGQNLHERVVMEKTASKNSDDDSKSHTLLFSNALASPEKDQKPSEEPPAATTTPSNQTPIDESDKKEGSETSTSLVEAARKWEEMRGAQKRKYEEVEVTTGEEDERNILDISCKLFTFVENNWEERGRGNMRLNDSKSHSYSRVVFRASGSLRVLLNTKVWRDQTCEQPSQKSLRITAIDPNGVIKIYLVMARNEDVTTLFEELSSRIKKEKKKIPEPSSAAEESNDDEDEDDDNDEPANKKISGVE